MSLFIFVDKIITSLNNGDYTIGLFLGFKKVIDTINHDIFQVSNDLLNFFAEFLYSYVTQLSRAYRKVSVVLQHGTAGGVRGGWGDLTGRSATVWRSSAIAVDSSKTPVVVSVGVPDLPTSSSLAGPSGPAPDDQTRYLSDLSAILADLSTLHGFEPVPPPPVEPYENYLRRTGRLSTASSSLALQPAASDITRQMVTLPSAFPRPFPTFEGLELHPRAPVPAPGLAKLLRDHCYAPPSDPWTWPRPGPVVPSYPSSMDVPGIPPVHTGPSRTFPDAVAAPPGHHPVMPTPGPATKSTLSGCHAPFPWTLRDLLRLLHPWPLFLNSSWSDLQCPPPRCQQPRRVLPLIHHLRSLSRPPRSLSRPPRFPQWLLRRCLTSKIGWKTWRTLCFLPWKIRWWIFWVLLHPSRLWVSLFLCGLWALTCCGRRAPLVTEHHHGFRVRPVQRERTEAPGPGALQVYGLCLVETGSDADNCTAFRLRPTASHLGPNRRDTWAIAHNDAHVLLTSVGAVLVHSTISPRLLILTVMVAIPLLHVVGAEHVPPPLVVPPWPACPAGTLGTCLCHPDAVHILHRRGDHPGALIRPLAPGGCSLIATAADPAPDLPRLAPVEDPGHAHVLHSPGLHPGIVVHVRSLPNSSFFILGISHQFLHRGRARMQIFSHLPMIMSCLLRQYANALLTLSARWRFLITQTIFLTPLSWAISLFRTSRTLLSQL